MSLSEQAETRKMATSVRAHLASNWIEIFAVPIASAIMETQPIVLVLQTVGPKLLGEGVHLPDAISVTLMMLGLHWWFIWLRGRPVNKGLYSALGIVLTLALFTFTHITFIDDIAMLFITLALTAWFWKRGMDRARLGLSDEQLITSFKVGFIALLVIMIFALLSLMASDSDLNNMLLRDLPIFFLSGMIALSFTRIGILQQEQAHHGNNSRKEGTGSWIAALTVTWIALTIISVTIETLPLATIQALLMPLWIVFGWIAFALLFVIGLIVNAFVELFTALVYIFFVLFGRFFPKKALKTSPPANPISRALQATQHTNGNLNLALRIVAIIAVIAIVIIAARYVQKKRTQTEDNMAEEEELRENLDRNQIRKERREERKQRQKTAQTIEALDPASARARYRDFLTSIAEKSEDLRRRTHETPAEYQQRILKASRQRSTTSNDEPGNDAILDELTQAYVQERYGGKHLAEDRQAYLRQWVPQLIQRLSNSIVNKPRPSKPAYQPSRWGED